MSLRLESLRVADASRAADVLVPAFFDDPNMAWCFGRDEAGYAERLRGYFVDGRPLLYFELDRP